MVRSPPFRVYYLQLCRPIQTRFRFAYVPKELKLATDNNSQAHYAKGTQSLHQSRPRTPRRELLQLVGSKFQVLLTPLTGVLFTFPSRYLFTIGRQLVFSLTRWAAQIHTGFHVSRATQEFPCAHSCFRIRGFHPLWIAIPRNSPNIHDTLYWAPTTPVR